MYIHEREIWLLDLNNNVGIEINKVRPALVLRKFSKNHYIILPITSTKKEKKISFKLNNISFLYKNTSYINISQIRTVDIKRFKRRFGKIPSCIFEEIQSKTAEVLKLPPQGPIGHNS